MCIRDSLFSTAFLAYLPSMESSEEDDDQAEAPPGGRQGDSLTAQFVLWTRKMSLRRARLLRASVGTLAGAIALLPAPFVSVAAKEKERPAIAWPTPASAVAQEEPELRKVLYTAQVAEAAEQRKQSLTSDTGDPFWTGAFVAFLLVSLAVAFMPTPRAVWRRIRGSGK